MKKQFGKISLKKTYAKNMSVKKNIVICRDFTPFMCKKWNKCINRNKWSKNKMCNQRAFHLKFLSSHRDVPWKHYFKHFISWVPSSEAATERYYKMEFFHLWLTNLKNLDNFQVFLIYRRKTTPGTETFDHISRTYN